MSDDPVLHDVLRGSLVHHAEQLGEPIGDIGTVWSRVDRRRARRRGIAVTGSVLAVAAGATGIMLLPDESGTTVPGTPSVVTGPPVSNAWRCTGELNRDDTYTYYSSCEMIDTDGSILATTTTIVFPTLPQLSPATSAPIGTSPVEQIYIVRPGDSIYSISAIFGIEMDTLVSYNGWTEGIEHPLVVDEAVKIPPGAHVPDPVELGEPFVTTLPTG